MLRRLLITLFLFTHCFTYGQGRIATGSRLSNTFYQVARGRNPQDSITVSIAVSNMGLPNRLAVESSYGKYYRARIRIGDVNDLLKDSTILFIAPVQVAREELTSGAADATLNGINLVHARFALAGASLHASIKERLFDTTDIDLKGRIIKTGTEPTSVTAHASLMATIVAGGGNSSPAAKGAGWRANVSSSSFLNLFPEPDSIISRFGISVQNHSYGTTVENFYGSEAAAYDLQSNQLPSLLHVFSSGNSGDVTNTSGPYAGVQQVANLTGNFKEAKNIITVGSIDSAAQLMPLSSKGPAYDGRIKPDLMAYGEDGSSGAAALVSGAGLLVQDAFKVEMNNLPTASLVKASLINSADDIGNRGVDYTSGFGSMNAYRAVETIKDHHYIEGTVSQNAVSTFNLHVPSGIKQLKMTLVWNDPAAPANAIKALVNDLDLQLYFPQTGERWDPWILDPSANSNLLQQIPQRKKDTLNNVEQITLDQPVGGDYVFSVTGSKIISGSQAFSIAWQFDTANTFYWTYPTATDPMPAGSKAWLRWSTNTSGSGEIEYATGNNNWRSVGLVPDLSKKYFQWILPDTLANVVLRMKLATGNISSDTITISPRLQLQTGFVCEDSFLLYWKSIASSYRLYELSNQYLSPFMQTPDSLALLNQNEHPSLYYAIAPIIQNHEGIRSNTVNYPAQGVGCYVRTFYLREQTADKASFSGELGTLYGVAEISLQKRTASGFVSIQTVSQPKDLLNSFDDAKLDQGENQYRLQIVLKNGKSIFSSIVLVYHLPSSPVVLYPNPVPQNNSLKIISNEVGRYTLRIIDASGRIMLEAPLNSSLIMINSGRLSRGLYFIRILDSKGPAFSQKLVVY